MAKEKIAQLNEVYNSILGKGQPLTGADEESSSSGKAGDDAYKSEDYSDDAGDGVDPRDGETEKKENGDEQVIDDDSGEPDSSAEEKSEEDGQGDEPDDEDSEVIPERLVSAGRRARLDDATIVELAETRPEILEALAKAQESAASALASEPPVTKEKAKQEAISESEPESDPLKEIEKLLNPDEEGYDELTPTAKQIIKALMKKVESLDNAVKSQSEGLGDIQKREQRAAARRIDEFFDAKADSIPVLGDSSKKLSQEQVDARLYAYRIARGAQQTWGSHLSDEEALAIGVNALKGSLSETQLKAKLVSDLNRNKKRFTARYKGRNHAEATRSAADRAREAIDRVLDDPKYKQGI